MRRTSVLALDPSLALRTEFVLELARPGPAARVLDLGCATGAFAATVAEHGALVTAVDVVPANLELLRRLHAPLVESGRLAPVLGDAAAVPLPDASFDAAFCLEVLEHVEDDERAARELARVLRVGGTCVVSVPNRHAPAPLVERVGLESVHGAPGPERHVRPGYSRDELRELLARAGLRVVEVTGVGGSAYRAASGLVSLVHLGFRRARGQRSWTWADVEADADSPLLGAYRALFPLVLAAARVGRSGGARPSTLVALAERVR